MKTAMEKLIYKKASVADMELLVQMRIEVLRAANGLSENEDMTLVEQQSRDYYEKALGSGMHAAWLVFDGKKCIGTGGVSFFRVMPTFHNPTGWKAYIMNMYTDPEYRRKGIAGHTLKLLIDEAKSRGISHISLEATDMGRPLYESHGFVKMEDEMILPEKGERHI